jgi:hypothetical protein
MKRDIIVALSIGILIGSVAALSFTYLPYITNGVFKGGTETYPSPNSTPNPDKKQIQPVELNLSSPSDNFVSDSNTVNISGITKSSNIVVIDSDTDYSVNTASADGSFKIPINLSEGLNKIYISVYNQTGDSVNKSVNVFYTSEKI